MLSTEDITWLHRLSGYSEDELRGAVSLVDSWGLAPVSAQLGRDSSADGHLAAVMLVQAIGWLAAVGVDESRLLAKLRRPDVWSMWTEIRVAGLVAHLSEDVEAVELDVPVGGDSGRNTDFRFRFRGERDLHRIEVKALSLSAREREFCRAWAPMLRAVKPTHGFSIFHANIDTPPPLLNRQTRRAMARDTARNTRRITPPCGPVSGTVIAAHGTREQYVRRLSATMNEHLSQLPDTDVGWMAFHWSNGAPLELVAEAVQQVLLPDHIAGIMLAGSAIVLDGRMHHMLWIGQRGAEGGKIAVHSKVEGFDASPLVEGFTSSVGMRPTILRVPAPTGVRELLVRDGSEPFWPFNLLPSPDHPDSAELDHA